jgi:hypothetical protein
MSRSIPKTPKNTESQSAEALPKPHDFTTPDSPDHDTEQVPTTPRKELKRENGRPQTPWVSRKHRKTPSPEEARKEVRKEARLDGVDEAQAGEEEGVGEGEEGGEMQMEVVTQMDGKTQTEGETQTPAPSTEDPFIDGRATTGATLDRAALRSALQPLITQLMAQGHNQNSQVAYLQIHKRLRALHPGLAPELVAKLTADYWAMAQPSLRIQVPGEGMGTFTPLETRTGAIPGSWGSEVHAKELSPGRQTYIAGGEGAWTAFQRQGQTVDLPAASLLRPGNPTPDSARREGGGTGRSVGQDVAASPTPSASGRQNAMSASFEGLDLATHSTAAQAPALLAMRATQHFRRDHRGETPTPQSPVAAVPGSATRDSQWRVRGQRSISTQRQQSPVAARAGGVFYVTSTAKAASAKVVGNTGVQGEALIDPRLQNARLGERAEADEAAEDADKSSNGSGGDGEEEHRMKDARDDIAKIRGGYPKKGARERREGMVS